MAKVCASFVENSNYIINQTTQNNDKSNYDHAVGYPDNGGDSAN